MAGGLSQGQGEWRPVSGAGCGGPSVGQDVGGYVPGAGPFAPIPIPSVCVCLTLPASPVPTHGWGSLTQRYDQEAHVAQPVGCLVGELLHEEPQHCAEVVLGTRHCDLHWRRRLGVAVAAGWGFGTSETAASFPGRPLTLATGPFLHAPPKMFERAHYLWIRETMVLKAACTSAGEQVQTTGSVCLCRTSDRNCGRRRGRG